MDFLDRQIFGWAVSKKGIYGLSKKDFNEMFWTSLLGIFGQTLQIFANFGNFWANFGPNRAFSLADRFFFADA